MYTVHSLVTIAELQPSVRRSFKAYRTLSEAVSFISRRKEGKLSKVAYGNDPRDVRFIVNYRGR